MGKNLSDEEALLSAVLEATNDGILIVDRSRKIVTYNKKFETMWKLPEELLEKGTADIILKSCLEQIKNISDFEKKISELNSLENKAGSFDVLEFKDGRCFERKSAPYFVNGVKSGRVWYFHDISKKRQTEREQDEFLRRAQGAVKVCQDNVAIVAHDLKNPLTTIISSVSLLARMVNGDLATKLVGNVRFAATRMDNMIRDLLDLSKIEAGNFFVGIKSSCDVNFLLDEAIRLLQPIADQKSIRLFVERVDGKAMPVLANCNRERVLQVFSNTIGNAIQVTKHEGTITIRAKARENDILFEVRDHGPGIPEKMIPFIFNRHWQPKKSGVQRAAGLGLFIAKSIIQGHGGEIWVESKVNVGTSVYFTLPLAARSRKENAA